MATIQLILNAVNNASKTLDAVAASADAAANRVDALNAKLDLTSAALDAQAAAASRAADQLDSLARAAATAAAAQDATAAKLTAGANAARFAYGWWGALFGRISLFGGAASISGLHLAVDLLAEIAAVVLPAGVALGAFGVAASDAVNNIVRHFTDLHTVMDATNTAIFPMTGSLEKLHAAVQPDVYQLLGDALLVANSRMGEMQKLAMGTGTVLDQLGARAATALESAGVSKFLDNAVTDVAKLGDVVGNIFGIVGNLLKTMPGYAQVLLNILDGVTRGLEAVTASGVVQWIIRLGLAFHGAFVYMGLAATAVLALRGPLTSVGTWALGAATKLAGIVTTAIAVGRESGVMAGALSALSTVPVWAWVAIGAAALAGLVFWLSSSKTATQQWVAQLQGSINSQTTWKGLLDSLASSQAQVAQQLGQSQQAIAKMDTTVGNMAPGMARLKAIKDQAGALQDQRQKVSDLTSAQQKFDAEQATATSRMADLSGKVGGTSLALGLMSEANVKVSDTATASASAWAQDVQQVLALQEGLRAMSDYAAGGATTSLQVLDNQATDQYKAIQSLNSAWDTFTSNFTQTQSAFDTVAQGLTTLTDSSSSFTLHLGKLQVSAKYAQTAIDALTPAGIALNQAFTQQVSNTSALYDTWRTAGIAANLFNQGVKDSIAPLLKYAAGSQEATDQLVGLAEQAGYQGPASLKSLTQWLGNTGNATQNLKNIANQATQQEALLTGAMNAQGNTIANQLLGDINNAILKYDGVQQAATAYGNAIAKSGAQSDAAKAARTTLINDLIAAGRAAGDSTGQIAALISKITGIPASKAVQIILETSGQGIIKITGTGISPYTLNTTSGRSINTSTGARGGLASGGYIRSGSSSIADDVPAMLSRGELVVPANIVRSGAVNHLRGAIPGFAAGGVAGLPDKSISAIGQASIAEALFGQGAAGAMAQAADSAALNAAAAASSAAAGAVLGLAGLAASSGYQAFQVVAAKMGWGAAQLQDWVNVEMREAGFSLTARNPTSGAYGMAQFIQGPSEYAQYGGNAGTWIGQAVAMANYIRQRYGTPAGAWAHEQAFNWYGSGGLISEPVVGVGLRSGQGYGFGENGPETVVPGTGGTRGGPLISIAEMHVHDEADAAVVAQRLSGMIRMASLGGGWRK